MSLLNFGRMGRKGVLFSTLLACLSTCIGKDQQAANSCREDVEPIVAIARRIDRAPPEQGLGSAVTQSDVDEAIGLIYDDPCFSTAEAKASAFTAEMSAFLRGRFSVDTFPWETPLCCEPDTPPPPPEFIDRGNRAGSIRNLVSNTLDRKLAERGDLTFLVREVNPFDCSQDPFPGCRWRWWIHFKKSISNDELNRLENIYFATSSQHEMHFILRALEQADFDTVPSWLLRQTFLARDFWTFEHGAKLAVKNNLDDQLLRRLAEHQAYFAGEKSKLTLIEFLGHPLAQGTTSNELKNITAHALNQIAADKDQSARVREAALVRPSKSP